MTNNQLTREWLQGRIANMECYGVVGDEALILQAYRMALAAMDSEPVAWTDEEELRDVKVAGIGYLFGIEREANKFADPRRQIMLYRHAQPAQTGVDDDVRSIIGLLEANEWAEHCTETVLGSRLEAEITRLVGCVQPAPVVPEEATPDSIEILASARRHDHAVFQWDEDQRNAAADSWNACRAAMLQDEPVTTANKLGNSPAQIPIDHGYRKGCECSGCKTTVRICAELAGKSPVIGLDPASGPDRTVEVRYVAPPGYVMVPKEPTDEMQSAGASAIRIETTALNKLWTGNAVFRAMLAAATHDIPAINSVQSVVTVPGKWIPVSERMPENDVSVLTFDGMYKRVHHAMYGHWQCWNPEKITHWMPLPAAPQEVK